MEVGILSKEETSLGLEMVDDRNPVNSRKCNLPQLIEKFPDEF